MRNIYVLIKADGQDINVTAYKDKFKAAAHVMEECYGEDWELQMEDEDWEESYSIRDNYEELINGYGFRDAEDVLWSIEETEVID